MEPLVIEELRELYKNPPHRKRIHKATIQGQGVNPSCGDTLQLDLEVQNGTIVEAGFQGDACAISILGAERLLEALEGKTLEEAKNLTEYDLLKLLGFDVGTGRLKCATLALRTLRELIKDVSN